MALFKFLLSMPRLRATRDHVSESLWPDIDAERAGKALRAAAYQLRGVLGTSGNRRKVKWTPLSRHESGQL